MAGPRLLDSIWCTSTTSGTGTYTLGAARSGFRDFAAAITASQAADGDTVFYAARDIANGGYEWGIGTLGASGTTLARTTIVYGSNTTSAVSWGTGTREIICSLPASMWTSAGLLGVANGGTALATLTAHALYVGNGTSAPTALAVGAVDIPLVGVASADPIFRGTTVKIDSGYGAITDDGSTGTGTVTFNLTTSNRHKCSLNGSCTFAVSNATTGQDFKIRIAITGSFTITWFSGITWITGSGAAAPTLPTTNGSVIVVMFECTGTNTYDGYLVGTSGT